MFNCNYLCILTEIRLSLFSVFHVVYSMHIDTLMFTQIFMYAIICSETIFCTCVLGNEIVTYAYNSFYLLFVVGFSILN